MKSVCRRPSVESKQCANGVCLICEFCERNKYPSWEKGFFSVWGQNTVFWWVNFFVVIWVILKLHEKHLQRVMKLPFIYDRDISKMEEYNAHDFKELWIRKEDMPFLHHEGPFLVSRRACSRTLKGVFHNLEWPPLYLRTMKIAYKHTLLNPPKQPCLVHNPAPYCPHLLLVSP